MAGLLVWCKYNRHANWLVQYISIRYSCYSIKIAGVMLLTHMPAGPESR